jgi:hypothetical protein
LLLASGLALEAQAHAQATAAPYRVAIREMQADFSNEGWKDEPAAAGPITKGTVLPQLPAGATGAYLVYQNPYNAGGPHYAPPAANAWGYHLNLTLEILDSNGQTLTAPDTNLYVDANLVLPDGRIPSKLAKLSATQFLATFDLDGENGKPWPAFLAGTATLAVDIYQQPSGAQPVKVGSDTTNTIRAAYGASSVSAFPIPRNGLPVYTDIGNVTLLHAPAVLPNATLDVSFAFGVPNAPVRVELVDATNPFVVADGHTDSTGSFTTTVQPAKVLGSAAGGLVLLEAHLTGDPSARTVGNSLVVLPVAAHATPVTTIMEETRLPSDPAATIRVEVYDKDASATGGAHYGQLDPIANGALLTPAAVPFQPIEPGQNPDHEVARYPAYFVTSHRPALNEYTLVGFLFGSPNELYSLTVATRGIALSAAPVSVAQGGNGTALLAVQNLDANGDSIADPGMAITAHIVAKGLPGTKNWSADSSVAEGAIATVAIPFSTSQTGTFAPVLNATADEISATFEPLLSVTTPSSGLAGLLERLTPAPSDGLVVAAIATAAAAMGVFRRNR